MASVLWQAKHCSCPDILCGICGAPSSASVSDAYIAKTASAIATGTTTRRPQDCVKSKPPIQIINGMPKFTGINEPTTVYHGLWSLSTISGCCVTRLG